MTAIRLPPRPSTIGFGSGQSLPAALPAVHRRERSIALTEFVAITGLAAVVLFALGYWTTVDLHIIFADGESRLAHAYMAIWDRPAKLATMGFVWPPLQTLVLLPFALIKPLATSLTALPLFSALCGGALLAVLNRTLTLFRLSWAWRYALLTGFALNPLFLCYGSNGMAEIQYLLLMACGLHYLIAWQLGGARSYRQLAISGVFMGLGFLSRYELAAWTALMSVWIALAVWPRRRRWSDLEAPLLIFLSPTIYMAAVWSLLSMQVVGGGPLSWFTRANDQPQGGAIPHAHALSIFEQVITLTGRISPLLWIVPICLIVLALARRDAFTLWLAALVLLGATVTLVLTLQRPETGLLQPRYNIRSLPAMLIGAGWLLSRSPSQRGQRTIGIALVIALLAAVPIVFSLEEHDQYQYHEAAWVQGLRKAVGDENTTLVNRYTAQPEDHLAVADWINAHVTRPKSVLIDDGAFPDVILFSGRPTDFVARTDHGDTAWMRVLRHPWGRVRYIVVENPAYASFSAFLDKVDETYPHAYMGGIPGTRVAYRRRSVIVLTVAAHEPLSAMLSDAVAGSAVQHTQRELELETSIR